MKVKEIRDKSNEELEATLLDLKKELFNLRFRHATNQLDNPLAIAEAKKSIARVKTVIRERELEETV
ncbi:MAG: 50S ribosomal protein L29 [Clostridia bacterium]|nr:50S ribosomal protein L29 [Clostridia bacterium]